MGSGFGKSRSVSGPCRLASARRTDSRWSRATRLPSFVASAEHVHRYDLPAGLRWRSPSVGVDGVVIDRVATGFIYGVGEYDPPGGWRPFVLDLESGQKREGAA
jgi:hypothetical protein